MLRPEGALGNDELGGISTQNPRVEGSEPA